MKHFFNKFLCMHPRLVLCFFFAMSANPLVASLSFENSSNTRPITKLYPCDSIVFHQGEDININFDTLDDREKKLLLDGYARENLNEDKFSFFPKNNLALVMNYLGNTKEKSTLLIPTNDALEVDLNTHKTGSLKKNTRTLYLCKKDIVVTIPINCLVDPKEVALYKTSKELLLCGFLSRKNRVFIQYIPKDILQTLILFIHDDTIPNRIKESKSIENMLKVHIKEANENITGQIACREKEETNYRRYVRGIQLCCCCSAVNTSAAVISFIIYGGTDETVLYFLFFIASLVSIGSLGYMVCYKRETYEFLGSI